jgi:nucleoside-diphosphate-sugar epimerase
MGGRLCEVMALTGVFEPRPFVHSTAAAWRITRFPLEFAVGDLCDKSSVMRAMKGCDAVIHLARGDRPVMRDGLENVLRAATDLGVSRFVHMSSVAVYGNQPPPESAHEDAPARMTDLAYGNEKLWQERLVTRFARRHNLPIVILRPPNVYGPFAPFTTDLVTKIRNGNMAIVDGGENPCNLVYIDNLVEAVLLSLWKAEAVGQIFFVTDTEIVSWQRCISDHGALLGCAVPNVSVQELLSSPRVQLLRDSIRSTPRVLLSGEFRSSLRRIPLFEWAERIAYDLFQKLPGKTRSGIRLSVNGPTRIVRGDNSARRFSASNNLIAAQARTVAHSNEKARRMLGYTAPVSYVDGMKLTEDWLRFAGML